ncbi:MULTISPECIES: TetR/AcrR family transcriptional regulator [unclassified Photobacterium]|uniref:TetR/AcrR family transcriptional regulator n=1 Tax=unclassified Photobacterium TaxID=2628852 RepID=UPI000D168AF2|nr:MULTISPECIES: TetR/AcrR family transcriptional regulator [unclassified Photobacterium]PSV25797.1 TetR family transcriptional regulator [Photobacterium sp. GB-56]PSV30444.1 TetR family transcriptional regulator [Photobacterium sp. GB-72]PSV36461.1 TetR family transcriptional regulator [Photobacterium sp. GB-210]PSV44279.1 TetR family transcriptional regulator [Photobacterium sp. GB-36]PSV52836.1 TetR family transcriptional regulator [Photobacterium sp. GB-1]
MKTRDRIIHAALALFNERGEPNVTTNHIAADLAISPGNLYYHFRNKEQIIHSIFDLYATDLQVSFQPRSEAETTESLLSYLDAVFLLMWRYRFFYANLPDILRRDPELQLKYLEAQAQLRSNIAILMQSLKEGGLVDIDDEDLKTLAETLLMVASSWISYQTTQVAGAKITPTVIYKGVIQILNIVRPLATPLGCERVEALKQYYEQQEQQAKR